MRGIECGRCSWVYEMPSNPQSWGTCPQCKADMRIWGNGDEIPDLNNIIPVGTYAKDPLLEKAEKALEK